jgi:hypothetical protein
MHLCRMNLHVFKLLHVCEEHALHYYAQRKSQLFQCDNTLQYRETWLTSSIAAYLRHDLIGVTRTQHATTKGEAGGEESRASNSSSHSATRSAQISLSSSLCKPRLSLLFSVPHLPSPISPSVGLSLALSARELSPLGARLEEEGTENVDQQLITVRHSRTEHLSMRATFELSLPFVCCLLRVSIITTRPP